MRLLPLILLLVPLTAAGVPIEYTFTSTVTAWKRNVQHQPLSAFEEEFLFPAFADAGVYEGAGRIVYDPDLLQDERPRSDEPMVFVTVNGYEFSLSPNLGFGVENDNIYESGRDGVQFADTAPQVVSGDPPENWYSEDGAAYLYDLTGTLFSSTAIPLTLDGLTTGNWLLFGQAFAVDPAGVFFQTRFGLNGTIDNVRPVPEPGTLALLGVGLIALLWRRAASAATMAWIRRGPESFFVRRDAPSGYRVVPR